MLWLASKKVRIVKITSLQLPITRVKSPHPSVLFGKAKQNAIFSKNVPQKIHLCLSV